MNPAKVAAAARRPVAVLAAASVGWLIGDALAGVVVGVLARRALGRLG